MRKEAHEGEMQILTLEKDLARDREELSRLITRLNQLGDEKLELERAARRGGARGRDGEDVAGGGAARS